MSHSVDERYAVYDERPSKARKPHECDACDEPIRAGDTYTRVRWIFDGSANGVKRCARCQFLHEFLRSHGDGDMWPAERLDCGEEYEEHWGREPAPYIAALAFWRPGDPLPCVNACGGTLRYDYERAIVHRVPWGQEGVCRPKPNGWGIEGPRENNPQHQEPCS